MKNLVIALAFCLLLPFASYSQTDSAIIKIHFLYGSKPAKGYKKTETRWFGGIHGGHVSIEADSAVTGFEPVKYCHIFPHRNNKRSVFKRIGIKAWTKDTTTLKYTSIEIKISTAKFDSLKNIQQSYIYDEPYDYAFFGMRCASATYDILSQIGLVKKKSMFGNVVAHFYPKLLRKKLLKIAAKNNWKISRQDGRKSRKWESD